MWLLLLGDSMNDFQVSKNNIMKLQLLKDCMMYRLFLIHKDYSTKNDYEKNEVDILALITESEITKIQKKLNMFIEDFNYTYNQ